MKQIKRTIAATALAGAVTISLTACGAPAESQSSTEDDAVLNVAATTYPVYQLANLLVSESDQVDVQLVIDQQISCLHDYTLTVNEMRILENADVILMNGAGLEDFMMDALKTSSAPIIDCSAGIDLLPYTGHEDHAAEKHGHSHYDPHIWLDPEHIDQMLSNIAVGLNEASEVISATDYEAKLTKISEKNDAWAQKWKQRFATLPEAQRNLITFHDGFAYLADAFDLHLLKSIEEEAGSEASAKDITEIVDLVRQYNIPIIFVEENGSDATAKAIQRETNVKIGTLSMLMSDNGTDLWTAMDQNLRTIYEGLSGEELPEDAE